MRINNKREQKKKNESTNDTKFRDEPISVELTISKHTRTHTVDIEKDMHLRRLHSGN